MTRNLYVGADLNAVIMALRTPHDLRDDQVALQEAIETIQRTVSA
jgi:hypothetical protein